MRFIRIAVFTAFSLIPATARSQAPSPGSGPAERASMAPFVHAPEPRPLRQGELLPAPELGRHHAAEVQAAQWATQRARVEWIPNVGVQATVQHDNASRDDVVGVQVALPLPLFDRNQGNIVAADAQLVAAQRNLERVRLNLQNRLAEVFRRYASAGQQVAKYRGTILPDAKETLDLVAAGYQQGEFSYLNLLTAQRTYFQSNLAYLESLLQLKSARAQIEGLLLNGSLSVSAGQAETSLAK